MSVKLEQKSKVENKNFIADLTQSHLIKKLSFADIQVSLFDTPEGEAALSGIFIRVKQRDGSYKIISAMSHVDTLFCQVADTYMWKTQCFGLEVDVSLHANTNNSTYYYTVEVSNTSDDVIEFDVTYGQDLGLASEDMIKTNEAYCSQYLDHSAILSTNGWVLSSRQNIPQNGKNPAIQIGCFSDTTSYCTDAFQFFGTTFKSDGTIAGLQTDQLPSEVYQYEMAYIAIQTSKHQLAPKTKFVTGFYGAFMDDLPTRNRVVQDDLIIVDDVLNEVSVDANHYRRTGYRDSLVIVGETMTSKEINQWFSVKKEFEEHQDGELLSFFDAEGGYVTLKQKELLLERPTGHIVLSGQDYNHEQEVMCSTHYMYGVFNSQLCIGNTSFQKLLSVSRNSLNFFKNSGQRIKVEIDGEYQTLGMCSAFHVTRTSSRWIYKLKGGWIVVQSYTSSRECKLQLEIETIGFEEALNVDVSHHLVFGNNEGESRIGVQTNANLQSVIYGHNELIDEVNPSLSYKISSSNGFSSVEKHLDAQQNNVEYLHYLGKVYNKETLLIEANKDLDLAPVFMSFNEELVMAEGALNALTNDFNVCFENQYENSQKLNKTLHWYTHNALVHYNSPHGLEQYSGAAWGTRDASQGPFEFFMSLGRFDTAKSILQKIYSHQYIESGTWPQWFMYDKYKSVQLEESHGDVVVWPLKALTDYIATTGDISILEMKVPFSSCVAPHDHVKLHSTLISHVEMQIKNLESNMINGTHLSSYGGGDWDDTLQPANQSLKENMVSGWTIPLTIQTLSRFVTSVRDYPIYQDICEKIQGMLKGMKQDFTQYLVKEDIVAGFIHVEDIKNNRINYLLHPRDNSTGITYRLLPANRSIIAELLSVEQAEYNLSLIKDKLLYPDGVRLMDKMAKYEGGQQTYFKRAELAANLGREVGLNYVHAHIRFIEALCKLGKAEELYDNLYKILPIGIQQEIPGARLRQSNAYFSSSDADFNNRYDAYDGFDGLKTGEVGVKGGWRIYSSGPGIYINQVISNVLGIKYENGDLVLDPVISKQLGNVVVNFAIYGLPVSIKIVPLYDEYSPKKITVNGRSVEFTTMANKYRSGGALIDKSILDSLSKDYNTISITI
ncbi:cellobiose phosphorylase [Vibrio sp. E150_011]